MLVEFTRKSFIGLATAETKKNNNNLEILPLCVRSDRFLWCVRVNEGLPILLHRIELNFEFVLYFFKQS